MKISRIHFLEDSNDEIFIARLMLQKQGYAVELIHHADHHTLMNALDEADGQEPCLCVVDLNMPKVKGHEIIRLLRERQTPSPIYAGICTGSIDPADRKAGFEAGADFFEEKPLHGDTLQRIVQACDGLEIHTNDEGKMELHLAA